LALSSAEYLIAENYTSSENLAIMGGSAGGSVYNILNSYFGQKLLTKAASFNDLLP
jgi:hypothetical protein